MLLVALANLIIMDFFCAVNIEKLNPRVRSGGLFTVELEAQILRLV